MNTKVINVLGYVQCKESEDPDFIVDKYYPILSFNNGVSILGESQEFIRLFHNIGDNLETVDNKSLKVVMSKQY